VNGGSNASCYTICLNGFCGFPVRVETASVNGQGVFVLSSQTTVPVSPRGVNYIRVDGNNWHSTFDPSYSSASIETALSAIAASGFNYVRVFLDSTSAGNGWGLASPGIGATWLDHVADFISRAASHNLHVQLTCPYYLPPNYESITSGYASPASLDGINGYYMHPGYRAARGQMLSDILNGLASRSPNLLSAVALVDIMNESFYDTASQPFASSSGTVYFDGKGYDMSLANARDALANDEAVIFTSVMVSAVKAVDASLLVGASVFPPRPVGHPGFDGVNLAAGDSTHRYPLNPLVLAQNGWVDYVDIHQYAYPSPADYLQLDLQSVGLAPTTMLSKPLLLGEFGAFIYESTYNTSGFSTAALAAIALTAEQTGTCDYGFVGGAIWTWDTAEQHYPNNSQMLWTAQDSSGAINGAVSPSGRPQFCPPLAEGFFQSQGCIGYANGSHYCVFATWECFVSAHGSGDLTGIPSYPRFPANMPYDGSCSCG